MPQIPCNALLKSIASTRMVQTADMKRCRMATMSTILLTAGCTIRTAIIAMTTGQCSWPERDGDRTLAALEAPTDDVCDDIATARTKQFMVGLEAHSSVHICQVAFAVAEMGMQNGSSSKSRCRRSGYKHCNLCGGGYCWLSGIEPEPPDGQRA